MTPTMIETLNQQGAAQVTSGQFEAAVETFHEMARLAPDNHISWLNLGIAYDEIAKRDGLPSTSQSYYERSLSLRITPEALNNLALIEMHVHGNLERAEALFEKACIQMHTPSIAYNLSICKLMLACIRRTPGAWRDAWNWYEHRPQTAGIRGEPHLWRGEPLAGRHLLVCMEQGLGDQIWALRWIWKAHKQGARVSVLCDQPMYRFLSEIPFIDQVFLVSTPHEFEIDYATMSMSMAGYLTKRRPETFQLPKHTEPKIGRIGLCWSGSVTHTYQAWRNIPPDLLAPLIEAHPQYHWVSLQKGGPAAPAGVDTSLIDDCQDVLDTANLIQSCELVISVDTMIPHLAATLGTPVWLMNRWSSCWQWGPPPAHDPGWYRGVEQFRQPVPGDWASVVAKMLQVLEK